jgi:long-chain acyl-CoA synthetase
MHEPQATPSTLATMLASSAARFASLPALATLGEPPLSYAAVGERVAALSTALRERGIGHGDRVALLGRNMPNWGIAYLAITGIGAVAVPILPDFSESEIGSIVSHSGAKAAFMSAQQLARVPAAAALVPLVFELDSLAARNDGRVAGPAPYRAPAPDDIAVFIYTSGTTGRPKGVMLTHRNLLWDASATLEAVPVHEDDHLLSVLPLAHTYECTLGLLLPLMRGALVTYLDRLPSPSVLVPALAQVRPTMMLTVPLIIEGIYRKSILPRLTASPILRALYRAPAARLLLHRAAGRKLKALFGGRLRFFGVGGAPLAADVERFLREARFPYAIGYGLTETSPLLAGCHPRSTRFRSTGPMLRGIEVRVDGIDPATSEGEIVVRGPNVMKGYYDDPGRTAEVLDADGWLRTGDRGLFDADGYLYLRGRSKNVIIGASGENIYPEEIEAVIDAQDFVEESLVLEADGRLIARVRLDYEGLAARLRVTRDELSRHVAQVLRDVRERVNARLSAFSRLVEVIEQEQPFERTPTRKIKRFLYAPESLARR